MNAALGNNVAASSIGLGLSKFCQSVIRIWQLDRKRRISRVARYITKSLLHPSAAMHWATTLLATPELSKWVESNPRMLLKPGRHYLSRHFAFASRVEAILNHFAVLEELLSDQAIDTLAYGGCLVLATLRGKTGKAYQVSLRKTKKFDREGELIADLRLVEGCEVFRFIFSLNSLGGQTSFRIGCMQGPQGDAGRDIIKAATKDLHGIRPRDLVAAVMYALAENWGISELYGVSNDSRVFRSRRTHADYDSYWQEIGASPDEKGMFRLPASLVHRPLSEVPSNHRAEYRRRIQLREDLGQQVAKAVNDLRRKSSR